MQRTLGLRSSANLSALAPPSATPNSDTQTLPGGNLLQRLVTLFPFVQEPKRGKAFRGLHEDARFEVVFALEAVYSLVVQIRCVEALPLLFRRC